MLKNLTMLILAVAAALTLGSMARNAGGLDAATVGFMIWAISPYVLVGLLVFVLSRFDSMRLVPPVALVGSILMLAFTAYVYWAAMDHTSSTEALAYVVVPLYLHIGGVIMLAIGAVISRFSTKPA